MTTTLLEPITARAFLFGEDADSIADLADKIQTRGALGVASNAVQHLAQSSATALNTEVARAVQGLVDLDLGDLAIAGWQKWSKLIAAARRTADAPNSTEIVPLVTHTVTSTHEPFVELLIAEVPVARVHAELIVEFTVRGLSATVSDGRLIELTGGSCEITATVSLEQMTLARRKATAHLPLVVRLGDGIALLRARQ